MTTQTRPYIDTGTIQTKAPCGCGGCGSNACQCSGSGCDATCGCSDGVLVQPHFFAGQLLTDEDLQALTNYVTTKQRLHNRFVAGSGVSCGLAVACHPCDPGKVIVQPGHAIDCCGNEIFVPCPVELDINAMVRDLKFKRLGRDCGDPCANSQLKPRENGNKLDENCDPPAERYCLYINYCETPTDPIAPYLPDETCSATCRHSRLREGFRFELRCPEMDESPPSWLDRVLCCIGDLNETEPQARLLERGQFQMERTRLALRAIDERKPVEFTDADENLVATLSKELVADVQLYDGTSGTVTEQALRRSLDRVQTLGSAIARYDWRQPNKAGVEVKGREDNENLDSQIIEARTLLSKLAPMIEKRVPVFLKSPLELAAADATISNTVNFIDRDKDRDSFEFYLYALNVVSSPKFRAEFHLGLANLKTWLLRRMRECPPTTECCLVHEVSSIVVPTNDRVSEATVVATDALVRALLRYLLDCICSALIPPCPTCEETSVKLACLEVKKCKVDNICNLERTFLLTGPTMRYWLPFLGWFGRVLELICCEFSKRLDQPLIRTSRSSNNQSNYHRSGHQIPLAEQPVYPDLLRVIGISADRVTPAINFGDSLGKLVARELQLSKLFEQPSKIFATSDAGSSILARMFENPQANSAIEPVAENQLAEREKKIEALAAESLKAAEDLHELTGKRIQDVERDLGKRLTARNLQSTKVIKDLTASLEELKKTNATLLARLAKLERAKR
jgi:hypothetical protein